MRSFDNVDGVAFGMLESSFDNVDGALVAFNHVVVPAELLPTLRVCLDVM